MSDPFLRVEHSITGRRWLARPYDERTALALAQRHGISDLVARSLCARGIGLDQATEFLDPKLRELLPDPSSFKDMDRAADRFAVAIVNGQSIAVFGDYDVDGATSSALLLRFAAAVGISIQLYVPDRLREGYGPNAAALKELARTGVKLVVCVDCGTTAHEPLAVAQSAGLDVIILDHHASEPVLPAAVGVVNPNRFDESGEFTSLAAVGVTYLFVIAVNRNLRARGFYKPINAGAAEPMKGVIEPDLLQWLDLVALGTICDVVKLSGLNRGLVAQGLRIASQRANAGISALAAIAGAHKIDAYAAGFLLGPRVNAGGRVGEATLGAKLLSTLDPAVASSLAQHLHELNAERRSIEARVLAEADQITMNENMPMAFVASENWHPGVIGIVAARLKDKYRHPAIVISLDGDIGKGSGRSFGNIDLGALIIAARQSGILLNGGGHKMAAGFTIAREKIEALKQFLSERIGRQMLAEPMVPTLTVDGLVGTASLTTDFVAELGRLGPFGTGNSEPRFVLADCTLVRAEIVGEKHVSVVFTQGGQRLRGIAFRAMENALGQGLLTNRNLHLAGHLRLDEWQGQQRVQLHIGDAAQII